MAKSWLYGPVPLMTKKQIAAYKRRRRYAAAKKQRQKKIRKHWLGLSKKTRKRLRGKASLKRQHNPPRSKKKLGLALIALYGIGAYLIYGHLKKS
jgi:hypothetical protein